MVISTLLLFTSHTVKGDCLQLSLFDRDRLMFCKSGILIFVFAENNHLVKQYICPRHVDENTFAPSELWSPCLSFYSFFLSLSLYFWLIPWSAEAPWAHFLAWASKILSRRHTAFTRSRGRPVPTCSSVSPKNRTLLAFRVNQGISASFSLLLSGPPGPVR